jgi:hypothetical protein
MSTDELAVKFYVIIAGREYRSAPEPLAPGQPISLEIEHRDNESSRLQLTVWDAVTDAPFVEFNTLPNPRCNPNLPVEAYAGWDEASIVNVFAGLFTAKRAHYQLSETYLVGIHDAFKLRKRGKVDTLKEITVAEMLKKKAAEEGINLIIDSTAAGDEELNTPASVFYQLGEANWSLMYRHIHELGYITNTIRKNDMVLKRDKTAGPTFSYERGDGKIRDFDLREEQKRADRSPKRKGHTHHPTPSQHWHKQIGVDCGDGRSVRITPPAIAEKKKRTRPYFAKASIRGYARRMEQEGDELTISLRFEPKMRNEEIITLSGFGPQIDGAWQTASVVHRLGGGAAHTDCACWRA